MPSWPLCPTGSDACPPAVSLPWLALTVSPAHCTPATRACGVQAGRAPCPLNTSGSCTCASGAPHPLRPAADVPCSERPLRKGPSREAASLAPVRPPVKSLYVVSMERRDAGWFTGPEVVSAHLAVLRASWWMDRTLRLPAPHKWWRWSGTGAPGEFGLHLVTTEKQ